MRMSVGKWVNSPQFEKDAKATMAIFAEITSPAHDERAIIHAISIGVPREAVLFTFCQTLKRNPPITCASCGRKSRVQIKGNWEKTLCVHCGNPIGKMAIGFSAGSKMRMAARSIANIAVKRGKLIPKPCEQCGKSDAEKHHPDYSKPLEVIWLCRRCHKGVHHKALGHE